MVFKRIYFLTKNFDWIIILASLLLLSFGLAALYGIATSFDTQDFSNFQKQIYFSFIGFALLFGISFVDYNLYRQYAYIFYFGSLLLLLAVLFFGVSLRGTTGWFSFFGVNFQPVEFAKITLIFFLARYFSEHSKSQNSWKTIVYSGIPVGILFFLTALQPDFGSALILFAIWFVCLLVSGIRRSHLFVIMGILIFAFLISWFFLFQSFQKDRILTFFNPSSDPYGRGYNVRQAVIGVGSGKVFGRGLASGSQSQLRFIPASQTDFIFAVISEELGLIGASLVLGFYFIFFYRMFWLTRKINDDFAFFVVLGIIVLFFTHFVINVGMNVGLLPVTGIGLPFISYGGSFLISSFLQLGFLESIARKNL